MFNQPTHVAIFPSISLYYLLFPSVFLILIKPVLELNEPTLLNSRQ